MEMTLSDFFETHAGTSPPLDSKHMVSWQVRDWFCDRGLRLGGGLARVRRRAASKPPGRVLIVGVEVPSRAADIHRVMDKLRQGSRHDVSVSVTPMGPRGKFENIDVAIRDAAEPLSAFDWLVVTDDDIDFEPGFLDDLTALADAGDLATSQPAHAFQSHTSYAITKRRWGSLVRQTKFVEIGPLTLFRADAFDILVPFPASRWCYGIDLVWTALLDRRGLKMGIIDGAPVRHLRPVAASYDIDEAIMEGRAMLRRFDVRINRAELWKKNKVVVSIA